MGGVADKGTSGAQMHTYTLASGTSEHSVQGTYGLLYSSDTRYVYVK